VSLSLEVLIRGFGLEAAEGRRERLKCGNGFEEARDAERIVNAAGGHNETQAAALSRESSALTHECADTRAINLDEAAQIHEHFLPAFGGQALEFMVEQFAVFAERGAAAWRDDDDVAINAGSDFEFLMVGVHGSVFDAVRPA
jgi:hypothetical protein